ncbi:MAG: flavoprotein [Candidatus Omnitrophota bacterium]|nr:flavoprotein [Candidatus Omnitrophota bacterium]
MDVKKKIILGVCGSIAAYKSCEIIRRLKDEGINVTVIMSQSAEQFITPLTLQTLSGNRVYQGLFDLAVEDFDPEHVSLAKKSSLILIAPATANIIGKIAWGICDCLLTCVIMASHSPILIAPAMNEGMWQSKILQENISKLKRLGYKFIGPEKGKLSDGSIGEGRLASADKIIQEVKKILKGF